MRLENKVAIITGAARGIGQAIAEGFAREGAHVIIADILGEQAEQTAMTITHEGGQALAVAVNLTDLNTHESLVNTALQQFGQLDILVNNAAIERREPFLAATLAVWEETLNINLRAPYFLAQRAAQAMLPKGGKIINIASIHDWQPLHNLSIYSITKGGIMMLTKSLALELAEHNINVNAISPGAILTDLNRGVLTAETYKAKITAKIPKGRIGTPADIAGAAIFLASDQADYVTGTTLYVDGGFLLQ
jgi:NAD(P)-dependent dehydrogenase (short-subunit alcohol dehydrogenase family)